MRPVPVDPCLALIHAFEGNAGQFEPRRSLDPAGNSEIGWSHKLSDPDDPIWFATLDADAADALAIDDLTKAAQGVCSALGAVVDDLSTGQYAACIDFAYNEGVGRFAGSTLCHYVQIGNMALAVAEFPKWVYAHVNGVAVEEPGLVRRRAAEVDVWNAPHAE